MNLREDQDLLYIAKEGLKAPLPENYKPYKRRTGEIVYVNLKTNEFQEEHPCDEYYRNLYQETKRKKSQKQTAGSKFKKNFPIAGGSPVSIKADPLPTMGLGLNQKKMPLKGLNNLDKSNISDQQESLSNNQDTSFSGIPTPLINKETKKKPPNANTGFSDSKGFSEQLETDPSNAIEALDLEYSQKFLDYSQTREDDLASLKKEYLLQREKMENKLRKDAERTLKELEEDLNESLREKTESMNKEKEKMKVSLKKEYEEKVEDEIKKLDKAHFNNKKNLHKDQEDNVQNSLADEEISIEQEYKDKKQVSIFFPRNVVLNQKRSCKTKKEISRINYNNPKKTKRPKNRKFIKILTKRKKPSFQASKKISRNSHPLKESTKRKILALTKFN